MSTQSQVTRRRPSAVTRHRSRAGLTLVAPFMIVFILMLVIPLIYAAYVSLYRTSLVGGVTFSGLANYARVIADPAFLAGLARMGLFLIIQVPIMLGLSLFIALALDSGLVRGQKSVRLIAFMPYAVPGVVAALMWGYLYGNDFGPIAQVFRSIGWGSPNLVGNENILGSMMNVVTWEYVGYNMIIMYSALRSIPTELYEAAELDGAGPIQTALRIKIPAIKGAIMLTVIFSVIGTFQLFNEPALMRQLNPTAIDLAYTPNYYAYNLAFINQDVNYAAAIAFVLGLFIAIISYVVQLGTNRKATS